MMICAGDNCSFVQYLRMFCNLGRSGRNSHITNPLKCDAMYQSTIHLQFTELIHLSAPPLCASVQLQLSLSITGGPDWPTKPRPHKRRPPDVITPPAHDRSCAGSQLSGARPAWTVGCRNTVEAQDEENIAAMLYPWIQGETTTHRDHSISLERVLMSPCLGRG
jgi:hypothetical protein